MSIIDNVAFPPLGTSSALPALGGGSAPSLAPLPALGSGSAPSLVGGSGIGSAPSLNTPSLAPPPSTVNQPPSLTNTISQPLVAHVEDGSESASVDETYVFYQGDQSPLGTITFDDRDGNLVEREIRNDIYYKETKEGNLFIGGYATRHYSQFFKDNSGFFQSFMKNGKRSGGAWIWSPNKLELSYDDVKTLTDGLVQSIVTGAVAPVSYSYTKKTKKGQKNSGQGKKGQKNSGQGKKGKKGGRQNNTQQNTRNNNSRQNNSRQNTQNNSHQDDSVRLQFPRKRENVFIRYGNSVRLVRYDIDEVIRDRMEIYAYASGRNDTNVATFFVSANKGWQKEGERKNHTIFFG